MERIKLFYRRYIKPHCKGHYNSYQEAKANVKVGYEDSELVNNVVNKTLLWAQEYHKKSDFDISSLGLFMPLILSRGAITVTDIGGAAGFAYFMTKSLLSKLKQDNVHILWNVVETAAMVKEAKKLEMAELKFTSFEDFNKQLSKIKEEENLDNSNILMISSTLQYLENPLEFLEMVLKSRRFDYIWITRTPLIHDCHSETFSIQSSKLSANGPQIESNMCATKKTIDYVITFLPLETVKMSLKQNGYEILCSMEPGYITTDGLCAFCYSILGTKSM